MKKIWLSNRIGLLLLATAWVAFFSRTLTGRAVYFIDDLKIIFYPLEHLYRQFQHAWQLPLWAPEFGFGHPLLAWGQLGFFTPLHLGLRTLNLHPLTLLQVSVIVYFAIGLVGMYVFFRRHRLDQIPAALGAIVFVFSGFNIGHLNHVNFYTGTMVLPWLLVAVHGFLHHPNRRWAAGLALLAGIIAISAQPQIVVYCFAAAAIYGLTSVAFWLWHNRRQSRRTILRHLGTAGLYLGVAGIIALALASLAILPLQEFLPETERSAALPKHELYEFSYPPHHLITLLLPYFYGDHATYWGAKGFQELAAFTGIIPLMLAGIAVLSWHRHRTLRIAGSALAILSLAMAAGVYSPLYRFLVEYEILTSLANPGRFVFFANLGIAALAAVAMHDLPQFLKRPYRQRLLLLIPGLLVVAVIVASLVYYGLREPRVIAQIRTLNPLMNPSLLLTGLGLIALLGLFLRPPRQVTITTLTLTILTAVTLIGYGWSYNPLVPRQQAYATPPFADDLAAYQQEQGVPARLYSRPDLLSNQAQQKITSSGSINPTLSIYQPVVITASPQCFVIPMHAQNATGGVVVSLSSTLGEPAVAQQVIRGLDVIREKNQRLCFSLSSDAIGQTYILSFTSDHDSLINLYYQPHSVETGTYVVRVAQPTLAQLQASQKPLRVHFQTEDTPERDPSLITLERHLHVITGASSARWIGALAIRPYREFIEVFFANDRDDIVDGAGVHLLERYRHLFDMAGVTHFIQTLRPGDTDYMTDHNFTIVEEFDNESSRIRLYHNPQAYPKAYLVPQATFEPAADEARAAMLEPTFNPRQLVYISGPRPPAPDQLAGGTLTEGAVQITRYEPTQIDLRVTTPTPTWLVVTDTTTPQWHTYLDEELQPYYLANTMFKAAYVPAGDHQISFRYRSPAVARATTFTLAGLAAALALLAPWPVRRQEQSAARVQSTITPR